MLKCESQLNRLFHALSDPGRRTMIDRLAAGPASLGQLAAPLAMSLPAVQQHLGVLELAGLVKTEKLGRIRQCRLDADGVALAESWLTERRLHWHRRFDRLEAHIAGDGT